MTVKANPRIVLMANEVTVAETDDAALWQHTLAAISSTGASLIQSLAYPSSVPRDIHGDTLRDWFAETHAAPSSIPKSSTTHPGRSRTPEPDSNGNEAVDLGQFAEKLKLDPDTVRGACDPTIEAPYMYFDVNAWQKFRRNFPSRGNSSIPPIVIAATLLVLWFKEIRLGSVTISQAQAVLNTIDTRDKNPARALKNCDWLQSRDGVIKLNPAQYDQAIAVARSFCSHQPIEE